MEGKMRNGKVIQMQRLPSPSRKVKLFLVTYWSQGLKVKGLLAEPLQSIELPGLLYLRGGIKSVGMVRTARVIQFASEGFIVFAPFYRGNRGGQGNEDFCGEDRHDAIAGFQLLREHESVDKQRIHLYGFSRGGAMALLTAIAEPTVRSVVCWNGVTDMSLTYEERIDLRRMLKRVIGGPPWKKEAEYKWRTPLAEINKINSPVCIVHGMKDEHVSFEHAKLLEEALSSLNKSYQTMYFEDLRHQFPEPFNRKLLKRVTDWMKEQ